MNKEQHIPVYRYLKSFCEDIHKIIDGVCIKRRSYRYGRDLVDEALSAGRWYTRTEIDVKISTGTENGLRARDIERGYPETLFAFKFGFIWRDRPDPIELQ